VNILEGNLIAEGKNIAIVLARFNSFLGEQLLEGARDCLLRHNIADKQITLIRVPGSFEIPVVLAKLISINKYDAIIALGVLIRGATPHFEYIASEVTKGIGNLAVANNFPISYGIITADSIEQAIERSGTKAGNKGWDAALAAIEMANLFSVIDKKK